MTPLKDYTGQKYNRLTFLNFEKRFEGYTYWKCKCDCGNEIITKAYHVVGGTTISCGCANWNDYTGQKFGKLTFIERVKGNKKRTSWKLLCDCGREFVALAENVIGGGTRSCGCVRRGGAKTFITGILSNYTRHAAARGYSFKLSTEKFIELIHQPCFYCGEVNSNTWTNRKTGEQYLYNGIDRFDNSGDYVEGNVVSCCGKCNYAKSDRSAYEFIEWAKKITSYQEHKSEVEYAVNKLFDLEVKR